MNRAARNLAILTAIAVTLVAVVLWIGRRDYVRDPTALTAINASDVTRIELDLPPVAPQVFEWRAGGWWRAQPSEARADGARVQRLANLAATPVARWIPAAKITPAEVGLAHPSATLVVNGLRIEYGGLTAIDDLRYARVGDKIALVPRQYSPEVILTKGVSQESP